MSNPRGARLVGGKRLYQWGDERFWSVTTIISAVPKPALVGWAAKLAGEFAADNYKQVAALMRKGERDAAVALVKGAPNRNRDKAANLGTIVHDTISSMVLGTPWPDCPPETAPFLEHFLQFVTDFDVTFEASEATCYSRAEKYAGTFDGIAVIPRLAKHYAGARCLFDLKTGKGVYPEVALQCAAYAHADFVGLPNGDEFPMPAVDCGAVLHLRPEGYELVPVRIDDEVFKTFLYVREVFRWVQELSGEVLGTPLDHEAAA